jgi:misacylated tRNA(Ala) deacylase
VEVKTRLLYQEDSYLKECEATVTFISGELVFFDSTIFHPRSGGIDHDRGFVEFNGKRLSVVEVFLDKNRGDVAHRVLGVDSCDLKPGVKVKLIIDWNRRYRLMRLHTAAHIISSVMYSEYGALVSGGNITEDHAYDDYTLEKMDKEIFTRVIEKANEIISKDLEVKIYWLPREEALRIPGIVKLASRTPPDVKNLRIVEIPGVDIQADGGPHVRKTSEIGKIVFLKAESKGKAKKRLYYTVQP